MINFTSENCKKIAAFLNKNVKLKTVKHQFVFKSKNIDFLGTNSAPIYFWTLSSVFVSPGLYF